MKKSLIAAMLVCLLAQPLQIAWADEVGATETPTAAVETQIAEASETPTVKPAETAASEPTATTAETPSATVTPEPTATEAETPSATVTPEPTETATVQPGETITPEPTETAQTIQSVSDKKQIPEETEAWMRIEGGYAYGTLEELIAYAQEGDTIVLHTQEVMHVKTAPVLKLSKLKFELDESVFAGDEWKITYLKDNPENTEEPEELDAETFGDAREEDAMEMFIRVDSTKENPIDPEETEEPEEIVLNVDVDDYRAGEWSNVLPTFTLSGKPEDERYSYALVIYDERIAVLSENVYTAETEGVYTVRFAILNAKGDIVSASERYTLMLDATAPDVSANVDYEKSHTLRLSATDAMSGVSEISMDGGNTWTPLADGEEWVYTAESKTTIQPGTLLVCDVAGNIWQNSEAYVLDRISSGGGGGGGGGTKKPEHAAGDKEEKPDYDTVELVFPEEPMTTLTMGELEMPLTLELSDPGDFEKAKDYGAKFTAALQTWPKPAEYDEDGNVIVEENPALDTLILTAVEEDNMGDRFEYRWKVNGEVFRLLENSGIKYLVLNVHDNYAVFPTAGFTGGTVYTELRMNGFSVKKFDYTIAMTVNLDPDHIPSISETDFSADCDFAVQVEADDQKYAMSAEQKGEMYFYDVVLGPEAMLEAPYGQYARSQMKDGGTDA